MNTITKFYIDGCFHCKHIENTFKEIAEEYKGKARFNNLKVNYPEQEKEYNLTIYPTVIVFEENGKELDRIEGVIPPNSLKKFVKKGVTLTL